MENLIQILAPAAPAILSQGARIFGNHLSADQELDKLNQLKQLETEKELDKLKQIDHLEKIQKIQDYCNRADALRSLERYEEAIILYEEAIQINPNNIYYWFCRGLCLSELQRYDKSIDSFQKVLEITEDRDIIADTWCQIGIAQLSCELYQEALSSFKQVISIKQKDSSWSLILASHCLFQLEDYEEASNYCLKAVQNNPNDDEVYQAANSIRYQIELKKLGLGFCLLWIASYVIEIVAVVVFFSLLQINITTITENYSVAVLILSAIAFGIKNFLLLKNKLTYINLEDLFGFSVGSFFSSLIIVSLVVTTDIFLKIVSLFVVQALVIRWMCLTQIEEDLSS